MYRDQEAVRVAPHDRLRAAVDGRARRVRRIPHRVNDPRYWRSATGQQRGGTSRSATRDTVGIRRARRWTAEEEAEGTPANGRETVPGRYAPRTARPVPLPAARLSLGTGGGASQAGLRPCVVGSVSIRRGCQYVDGSPLSATRDPKTGERLSLFQRPRAALIASMAIPAPIPVATDNAQLPARERCSRTRGPSPAAAAISACATSAVATSFSGLSDWLRIAVRSRDSSLTRSSRPTLVSAWCQI